MINSTYTSVINFIMVTQTWICCCVVVITRRRWTKGHLRGETFTACPGSPRGPRATCPGRPGNTGVPRPSSPPPCDWPDCWGSWATPLPAERPGPRTRSARGPGGDTGQTKRHLLTGDMKRPSPEGSVQPGRQPSPTTTDRVFERWKMKWWSQSWDPGPTRPEKRLLQFTLFWGFTGGLPLHSGTAPLWICPCRWEPRGRRPGPGSGAGGGTGGSTSHWGTGWSPPRGAGWDARTPPSGNPQGPVGRPPPAPRRISTDRVLRRLKSTAERSAGGGQKLAGILKESHTNDDVK